MNLRYIPGLRGIKTAVAVFLCLLVSTLLGRGSPFYSCIAAVVCMQSTHELSIRLGVERTIGTLIGGVVGYLTLKLYAILPLQLNWLFILILPAFLVLAVYLCNVLGREKSTAICCIVFLSIAINHSSAVPEAIWFTINRVLDTILGILAAILVNRFVFPRFQGAPSIEEQERPNQSPPA